MFEKWIKRLRDIARGEEKSEMPRPLENAGEGTTTWKFVIEGLDNLRLVPISFLRVARLMNIYGVTNFNLDRNENRGSCVILPSWTIFFSFSSFCIFSAEGKEEEEEEEPSQLKSGGTNENAFVCSRLDAR